MANNEKSGHRNRGKGGQRMKYEEYKDSGVEWIGEVPSHWEVMRFKDFTSLQTTTSDNMNKIGLENIEGKTGRFIESDSEFEGNGIAFNIGDVVYGKLRPYLQKVWIATFSGNAVGDFFVFRPKDNCYNQYLFYCMLSDGFTSMCNGSTVGAKMPRVSSDFIRSLHYYLPPLSEQQAIATYLDEKCGEVNCAIDVQKKKIELLNELKQTIITDAVTKGLNPNAPMKDSGVEWIGKVPEHWKVMKTSLAFTHIGSGTTPSTSKNEYYEDDGDFWLQTGDLTDGIITDTSKKVSKIAIRECNLKFYPTNSVVIAMYGATIGKMGLLQIECATNQACCVLPSNNHIDAKFTFYFFLSAKTDLLISAIGGGQPNISQDVIKKTKMIVPPLSEQQTIANYLDEECTKIDVQISNANHRIELLNELKQSIITEAVTGKIKVC
jgi:type I restriction enzyme S subunit